MKVEIINQTECKSLNPIPKPIYNYSIDKEIMDSLNMKWQQAESERKTYKIIDENISIDSLVKYGFTHQYPEAYPRGFALLKISDDFSLSFTEGKSLNLNKKQFGIVMDFPHIKSIQSLNHLLLNLFNIQLKKFIIGSTQKVKINKATNEATIL